MKILSVCTNLPTDQSPQRGLFVARRLGEMAKSVELRALNPEPYFPIVRPWKSPEPKLDRNFPIDVRKMFYVPKLAKRLDSHWVARCVDHWFNEIGAEETEGAVLDAHFGYPEGAGCVALAKKRGMPCFITLRGLEVDLFDTPHVGPQMIEALSTCTGVISVSDALRDAAVTAGVPPEQIEVIPNGIEEEIFHPGDQAASRKELGVTHDGAIIVCAANFRAVKGHDVLLKAFHRLPKHLNARLVLLGSPTEPAQTRKIHETIESLELTDAVEILGSLPPEQVAKWLRAADVFALATTREGNCNAILEALASGLPVVTNNIGSARDDVREGIDGFVVSHKDHDAFASALQSALERDWDPEQISSRLNGRTWSGVADRVLQFMDSRIQQRDNAS